MENLIHNILKGGQVKIPEHVIKSLYIEFPEALNIEWYNKEDEYEAIFYVNDIEKIVHFNNKGAILDTRTNLPLNMLPEKILEFAGKKGEIMNAISIRHNNSIKYELIIRDRELKRYLVIYNTDGKLIQNLLL